MKRLTVTSGFTITEAMVSIAIFAFLMTGLYTTLAAGRMSFATQTSSVIAQQQARNTIDHLTRALREVDTLSITSSTDALSFSYTDPVEGAITYAWSGDSSSANAFQLLRTASSATRVVADGITALSLTDNTDNYVLNVTAASNANLGTEANSYSLVKKIGIR